MTTKPYPVRDLDAFKGASGKEIWTSYRAHMTDELSKVFNPESAKARKIAAAMRFETEFTAN